jgi:hypothetical protein
MEEAWRVPEFGRAALHTNILRRRRRGRPPVAPNPGDRKRESARSRLRIFIDAAEQGCSGISMD